jgi:hypothetical protein
MGAGPFTRRALLGIGADFVPHRPRLKRFRRHIPFGKKPMVGQRSLPGVKERAILGSDAGATVICFIQDVPVEFRRPHLSCSRKPCRVDDSSASDRGLDRVCFR